MLLIRILLLTGFGKKNKRHFGVLSMLFFSKGLAFWPKQQDSTSLENSVSMSEMCDRKAKPHELILILGKSQMADKDYVV